MANAVLGWAASEAQAGANVAIAAARLSGPPLYEEMTGHPGITLMEWLPRWTVRYRGFVVRQIPREGVRRLQRFQPDLVHVHGEFNADNLWVPRLFRCPLVLSPHGAFRAISSKGRAGPLKSLYVRIAKASLYRRVGAVHTLSPAETDCVNCVLPDRPACCIPQGPNVRTNLTGGPEPEAPPGVNVRFIFAGRLDVPTKGLDVLLDAFASAVRQLPDRDLTLTLIGPDWQGGLAWMRSRAGELGLHRSVIFTGPLPGLEVAQALRHSHIYVQLSRSDCFPLSVSEALLVGKPAILSAGVGHASYPEIAALPHVRVVPPTASVAADAMVAFVRRLPSLSHWARDCQPQVSHFFSWDRVAELQLRLYRDVIAQSKGLVAPTHPGILREAQAVPRTNSPRA